MSTSITSSFLKSPHLQGMSSPRRRGPTLIAQEEWTPAGACPRPRSGAGVTKERAFQETSDLPQPGDTIFIIGAGAIVIGQACEFDYSGCQACKVLKAHQFRTVLLNANPATIMTDPEMADAVYIEPMTVDSCEKIIIREKPKYLLPTMGGQTALNLAAQLGRKGILKKHGVELLGVELETIEKAENREQFKSLVSELGYLTLPSVYIRNLKEALSAPGSLSFPLIIRPSFTLGGEGGVVVHTEEEYLSHIKHSLDLSPVGEVLVERSCVGWKEIELEVMKDGYGNCVIVCGIENFDPMGVHTGDSITVAPLQTVSDAEYQDMRNQAIAIMNGLGVRTGGANIQFCQEPDTGKFYVIEVNPRVSRSSALASKATGFPIAKIAALVAIGKRLDEINNDITHKTPVSFEPALDYVVVKIPKFNFEKFPSESPVLGVSMKAIGETMAVGRCFEEALLKGMRSISQCDDPIGTFMNKHAQGLKSLGDEDLRHLLGNPTSDRLYYIWLAFLRRYSVEEVQDLTRISHWFLQKIYMLTQLELRLPSIDYKHQWQDLCEEAISKGFTIAHIRRVNPKAPILSHTPPYSRVDTCAAEFESYTPYYYSSHSPSGDTLIQEDVPYIAVIGSGPNQIGQGLEFDYTCVHAAKAIQEGGFRSAIINNNPETVSTDYDTANALFFEPITPHEVTTCLQAIPNLKGALIMMGGQSSINVTQHIEKIGVPILGTDLTAIDLCEDRDLFRVFLNQCKLKCPKGLTLKDASGLLTLHKKISFPLIVRPSYIIGGANVHIFEDQSAIENFYASLGSLPAQPFPMVAEEYLLRAREYDCDVLRDPSGNVVIAGIMEHVEEAGVHSGDSTAVFPPFMSDPSEIELMEDAAKTIVNKLGVVGLINIQFALQEDELYVIEVNPRASRTVPLLSKIVGIPFAKIATHITLGASLDKTFPLVDQFYSMNQAHIPYYGVKKPVFPFDRFKGADIILGPQMKSTGEVMGIAKSFYEAYEKALDATGNPIPPPGTTFFVSFCDEDKPHLKKIIAPLVQMGYSLVTTEGTHRALMQMGISSTKIYKRTEGHPNILDLVSKGEIQFIFNTTRSKHSAIDEKHIRRIGLRYKVPYCTNLREMMVISKLIRSGRVRRRGVAHLKEFHGMVNLGETARGKEMDFKTSDETQLPVNATHSNNE